MKKTIWISIILCVLILPTFSCMDHLKTNEEGSMVITEGVFSPRGPLQKNGYESIPFILIGFRSEKAGEKFPLLMMIHGNGENPHHCVEQWKKAASKERVMILLPDRNHPYQGDAKDLEDLQLLANKIVSEYPVNAKFLTLAGASSGALMARQLAQLHPDQWSHLVLISSPPSDEWIMKINPSNFPAVLYAHGRNDEQFSYERIRVDAQKLLDRGVKVSFIDDADAKHETRDEWILPILKWVKNSSLKN